MFLELNGRQLFALLVSPTRNCIGNLLYLPAFAEEMNRFRQHATLAAHALAAAGYRCLLLDPHGTGESAGEIAEGDWEHWRDDAMAAAQWLSRLGGEPLTVWGARTGALLAAEVAGAVAAQGVLLWQPVQDGKLFLNQYLRLRIASQLVQETERETTETIRARLAAGEVVEVAGYPLTGAMADSLAARRLDKLLVGSKQRVAWLEVVAKPEQPVALPSRKLLDQLQAAGTPVQSEAVCCPMVWQVHERVDAPELTTGSLKLMGVQA